MRPGIKLIKEIYKNANIHLDYQSFLRIVKKLKQDLCVQKVIK